MHQKPFGGRALPGPVGGASAYSAPPDPLAGLREWGPWKRRGRGGEWRKKKEGKGRGKEEKERGGGAKEEDRRGMGARGRMKMEEGGEMKAKG